MSKDRIRDYIITKKLTNEHSGFAKWGFVKKEGEEFFIKEFLSPVYPDERSPISYEQKQKKINECSEWFNRKAEFYEAILGTSNGNIIIPRDFFRDGTHYYLVTDKVDTISLSVSEISALDIKIKLIILKVLAHCLNQLGKNRIIHGDLKPENLLIKETVAGMYTVKMIDFDSGYLESLLPLPEEIQCDPTYMAPEVFLYMIKEGMVLNHQVDIFSAGLIFHQYICGELPRIPEGYDYIYEAVLNGADIVIHESIPTRLNKIISMMLAKNPAERLNSEYLYQLMIHTTFESLYKASTDLVNEPELKKNSFRPASDDEW